MTDSTQQPSSELSLAQRQEILQREIEKWVAKGYSVESKTETRAILSKKKKIKLIKHVIIAAVTFGIWLLVLVWQTLNRKSQTVTISVDEKGKIRKS